MGIVHLCPNCHTSIGVNALSKYHDVGYCVNCGIEDLRKALRRAKETLAVAEKANKALQSRLETNPVPAPDTDTLAELNRSMKRLADRLAPEPCGACGGTGVIHINGNHHWCRTCMKGV